MSLRKRLNELEQKVVPDEPSTVTKLDMTEIPDAERELHYHANDISKQVKYADLTEAQVIILKRSSDLLFKRAIQVCINAVTAFMESDSAKAMFQLRLLRLIEESIQEDREFQAWENEFSLTEALCLDKKQEWNGEQEPRT